MLENIYLITGGAGFIGSSLADAILKEEPHSQIYIVDDLSMGKVSNLPTSNQVTFIEGSVTDENLMTQLLEKVSFTYIFHLAAVASVADSVARPVETHQVNFESVLLLLELIRKTQKNLRRLVFSSSAAVYGDEPTLPKEEESVIRPLTPYAVDKFAAERYVLDYAHLYQVPTSAVRFFNVYGPKQNPKSPYSGVISILVDRYEKIKVGEKASFTLFGDGHQSRDFVYIEDVIQALRLVAKSSTSLGEVYNVGTGIASDLLTLIHIMDEALQCKLPVEKKESRSGDIKDSLANISKIKNLGYNPQYTIEKGLQAYLKTVFPN